MIRLQRALVKPRVFANGGGDALPLEDVIVRFLNASVPGLIAILGPAGSGKTTALQHLAAVLPSAPNLVILDNPEEWIIGGVSNRLVVYTAQVPRPQPHLAVYHLAGWEKDDLIEYLIAAHKSRCASVMTRVCDEDYDLLDGAPELWRLALDRLANDDTLPDVRRALHRHLEAHLCDTDLLERARSACLNAVVAPDKDWAMTVAQLARPGFAEGLVRVLRQPPAQRLLAAERIAADLHGDGDGDCLAKRLPRDLVQAAAKFVTNDTRAVEHLHCLLAGPSWSHAMSASLLHAAGIQWSPASEDQATLGGAYLDGIHWPGVDLLSADLVQTDLSGADLTKATLGMAHARECNLSLTRLHAANLAWIIAPNADLSHADLSEARAENAAFDGACLEGANCDGAVMRNASFTAANLRAATFQDADLFQAHFTGTLSELQTAGAKDGPSDWQPLDGSIDLEGADFTNANLTEAVLTRLCLNTAVWTDARFPRAKLIGCNLEGLTLPGADFTGAELLGALLTGTSMPGACFKDAVLGHTGLADIDWEGADLRGADLRGATFHMGSSRSGLVGSPIACEGSKTGFYTDDYDEQTYKAPEEIRKANLCGADLRGANIEGVDFYLVDLRGAQLDAGQKDHLRRCGAILDPCCEG